MTLNIRTQIFISIFLSVFISLVTFISVNYIIGKRTALHDQIVSKHKVIVSLLELQKETAYSDDAGAYLLMADDLKDINYIQQRYNLSRLKAKSLFQLLKSEASSAADIKEILHMEQSYTKYFYLLEDSFHLKEAGNVRAAQDQDIANLIDPTLHLLSQFIDRKVAESDMLEHSFEKSKTIANMVSLFSAISSVLLFILACFWVNKMNVMNTILAEQKDKIKYLAYHDALTGVGNRRLIAEKIKEAIEVSKVNDSKMAIFLFDLDGFKGVNDTFGHDIGDELLIKVAKRVQFALNEKDTLARLGGDEFIILALYVDETTAAKIAQRIINKIKEPFHVLNKQVKVSASVGVSIFPNDGDNFEKLIKSADHAMYRAKKSGKDQFFMTLV
ncbi:GGDEF domain-containing protein [Paenibacillus aestuarii]|uniref:GGDEF domain-containing protein n=1 Tax=Paenibacillus aestuarii TaxID=516965 RepID=A0ABW0K2P8_9BACL|nr:GGDEF domain-containing protein [Paenibacillus aestuarii]